MPRTFTGRSLPAAERQSRSHDGSSDARGCREPTEVPSPDFHSERSKGIVLFTGERIASASARHILGEETSRALRQLRVRDLDVTRALEGADNGLMRCLERAAADPRNSNPGLLLLRQVQRGLVAEPARGWPRSSVDARGATATWRRASAIDAGRRTSVAKISLLVHGSGAERDGQRRSEGGVEACGAGAGTRGEPCRAVSGLRTPPTRVGRSNTERSLDWRADEKPRLSREKAEGRRQKAHGRWPPRPPASAVNSSLVHGRLRSEVSCRTVFTVAGSTADPGWPHSRRM